VFKHIPSTPSTAVKNIDLPMLAPGHNRLLTLCKRRLDGISLAAVIALGIADVRLKAGAIRSLVGRDAFPVINEQNLPIWIPCSMGTEIDE
jgi:hypothetical protein